MPVIEESLTDASLAEVQAAAEEVQRSCDCWGTHYDEGFGETCPRRAAWRVSVNHVCDCGECDGLPHQDLLLLCEHCMTSWREDPEGLDFVVLGRL